MILELVIFKLLIIGISLFILLASSIVANKTHALACPTPFILINF